MDGYQAVQCPIEHGRQFLHGKEPTRGAHQLACRVQTVGHDLKSGVSEGTSLGAGSVVALTEDGSAEMPYHVDVKILMPTFVQKVDKLVSSHFSTDIYL